MIFAFVSDGVSSSTTDAGMIGVEERSNAGFCCSLPTVVLLLLLLLSHRTVAVIRVVDAAADANAVLKRCWPR